MEQAALEEHERVLSSPLAPGATGAVSDAAGLLVGSASFSDLPPGDLLGGDGLADVAGGAEVAVGTLSEAAPLPLAPEELAARKRRREAHEREADERARWELHACLAGASADVEALAAEVARLRGEVAAPLLDLNELPPHERAALETARAKRLGDLVQNQCKKALQHITTHKVGGQLPGAASTWAHGDVTVQQMGAGAALHHATRAERW